VRASYFVLWAPNDLRGEAVALGPDGSVLQTVELCLPAADIDPSSSVGC
jgi:hypothetical protein